MTKSKILMLTFFLFNIIKIFLGRQVPVIAIYANPDPDFSEFYTMDKVSANIVRWLESSSAETVVINSWHNQDSIDEILSKANGVLFQGGNRPLNLEYKWEKNAHYILEKVKKLNNEGIYFPLFGTCQGFEILHALVAGTTDVISEFGSRNATPIEPVDSEIRNSTMFSLFSKQELLELQQEDTTAEFHKFGVSLDKYTWRPELNEFFKITSTGRDNDGKVFIATVEARGYPIYAVQFHPEKTPFEKNPEENFLKNKDALVISQRFSQFFVNEARRNNNTMTQYEKDFYNYINTYESGNRYYKEGNYLYQNSVPPIS